MKTIKIKKSSLVDLSDQYGTVTIIFGFIGIIIGVIVGLSGDNALSAFAVSLLLFPIGLGLKLLSRIAETAILKKHVLEQDYNFEVNDGK